MAYQEATHVDRVYSAIRMKIADGELQSGKRVSQRKLAREIGCSQIPVAEAMRRLESDGLLVKEPLKMAKVRTFSPDDVEGMYLIREGLESMAARLCAERITDEQIEELKELEKELERATREESLEEYKKIDMAIHRFIFRCARCPVLEEELERLLLWKRTAAHQRAQRPSSEVYINRHKVLVQAIADRDSDFAEYLAKKHVAYGRKEIMAEFQKEKR